MCDPIVRNETVVDGSGMPCVLAAAAIREGIVGAVAAALNGVAAKAIDVIGHVVMPRLVGDGADPAEMGERIPHAER